MFDVTYADAADIYAAYSKLESIIGYMIIRYDGMPDYEITDLTESARELNDLWAVVVESVSGGTLAPGPMMRG